jgi:hypothetical protein
MPQAYAVTVYSVVNAILQQTVVTQLNQYVTLVVAFTYYFGIESDSYQILHLSAPCIQMRSISRQQLVCTCCH